MPRWCRDHPYLAKHTYRRSIRMMQALWTACGPALASGATARLPAGLGECRRGAARSCSGPSGAAGSARARRSSPGAAGPGRSARPEVSVVLLTVFFRLDYLTVRTIEYMNSTHNMLCCSCIMLHFFCRYGIDVHTKDRCTGFLHMEIE